MLRLASRCQHLERWQVPRTTFPDGRAGYLAWRRSLYVRQAERARELLLAAGIGADQAADAAKWIAKEGLSANPGTQALEDAACLVFLGWRKHRIRVPGSSERAYVYRPVAVAQRMAVAKQAELEAERV